MSTGIGRLGGPGDTRTLTASSSRRGPGAPAYGAAIVALFAVWQIQDRLAGSSKLFVSEVAMVSIALATVGLMLRASWCASDRSTASAWRWLAAGIGALAIGIACHASYSVRGAVAPFPSLADPFYMAQYTILTIGLLRFPTGAQPRSARTRLLIDAATVAVSAISVMWFFVIAPTLAAGHVPLLNAILVCGYAVGGMWVLFGAVYVLMRAPTQTTRRAVGPLGLGAAIIVVADFANGWILVHSEFELVEVVRTGFVAGLVCFLTAAALQRRAPHGDPASGAEVVAGPRAGRMRWLPYVAPAVVLGLSVAAQAESRIHERLGLAVSAGIVTALVLARQLIAHRELVSAQGELSHRALHDALTDLPNRVLVLDRAEQLLVRARRQGRPAAALYVDVDGFKHINDTFGHAAGDELLKAVATRLSGVARESDTVGRMGGDEFVVLLDSITSDAGPELAADRVLEVLRQPIVLTSAGDREVRITASIGIAVAQRSSAEEMLRDADMALYAAKKAGKDRAAAFESRMQTAAEERLLMEMDLRTAADERQLFLLYQPTVDLQTELLIGVEALVRWRHPARGVLTPDVFIGLAEESGQMVPLGRWVLGEACRQAAAWHARGCRLGMSVNVSARQLDEDSIVDDVRKALATSGLGARWLTLEVTETALMRDPDETAQRLRALKDLGVRIAIDDFGTGYSSMAYLRQFPVDALKIDRVFISELAVSKESEALVQTLIQLGKSLGLETFGEGIEEPAQLRSLQRQSCDAGQGYLFARPLEADKVTELLEGGVWPGARAASA